MAWKETPVNGALLRFDRKTGTNVLIRTPETWANHRIAPRTLQIGLLSPCNLSCSFCYRDASAPSRLTSEFLLDLLVRADHWGVLEVTFGGGEPLLFKGFVELLQKLHERTKLGLNFTTNGTLLTESRVAELEGVVGEVRVSAYADNRYRNTLRRARRLNLAVNCLVTPANVGLLEPYVYDFLKLGARNVLLLGYKGPERHLHLDAPGLERLQQSVRRMSKLPLRLDICWHPHLTEVDHLFQRSDCGAGDEFLVITPDQAVQPCSFHNERIPFASFDELRRIYLELMQRRPAATIAGCTRSEFRKGAEAPQREASAWVWNTRASNNSGDYTIAARFCDAETAVRVATSLRELSRAHEAFLASDEGQKFLEGNDFDGSIPTPPLQEYGRAHGFDWSGADTGLWWEEDGVGAAVLTAGAVGDVVVVYHPYCMGLPEEPFRELFRRTGATEMGYWGSDRPAVSVRAFGRNDVAMKQVTVYLEKVQAAEYASDVEEEPPWGAQARDERVLRDEDRNARLSSGNGEVVVRGDEIALSLTFENTFAGSIAVEGWLRDQGFKNIQVTVTDGLQELESISERCEPRLGLFGDVIPRALPWDRTLLARVSDQQVVEWLFASGDVSKDFSERLAAVRPTTLIRLITEAAETQWRIGKEPTHVIVRVAIWLRETAADLVRTLWKRLPADDWPTRSQAIRALEASLPREEAYETARDWVRNAQQPGDSIGRLSALAALREPRLTALVEETCRRNQRIEIPGLDEPASLEALSDIAAKSGADWNTLATWIRDEDLRLARIAVRVLNIYCSSGIPDGFHQTDTPTLTKLLEGYKARESDERQLQLVSEVLKYATPLVRDVEGI